MYAVIRTGGKQERVEEGHVVQVELLGKDAGEEVTFQPVLLVDGDTVITAADALARSTVTARVVGEVKGPKITGFTYKNKTNNRRRWGHRQRYASIEITGISGPKKRVTLKDDAPSDDAPSDSTPSISTGGRVDVQDQGWRLHPQRP